MGTLVLGSLELVLSWKGLNMFLLFRCKRSSTSMWMNLLLTIWLSWMVLLRPCRTISAVCMRSLTLNCYMISLDTNLESKSTYTLVRQYRSHVPNSQSSLSLTREAHRTGYSLRA